MVNRNEAHQPERTGVLREKVEVKSEHPLLPEHQREAARLEAARSRYTHTLEQQAIIFSTGQTLELISPKGDIEEWVIVGALDEGTPDANIALQRLEGEHAYIEQVDGRELARQVFAVDSLPEVTKYWDEIVEKAKDGYLKDKADTLSNQKGAILLDVAKEFHEAEATGAQFDVRARIEGKIKLAAEQLRIAAKSKDEEKTEKLNVLPGSDVFTKPLERISDEDQEPENTAIDNTAFENDSERTMLRSPAKIRIERDRLTQQINEIAAKMPFLNAEDRKARMAQLVEMMETKRGLIQEYEKAKAHAAREKIRGPFRKEIHKQSKAGDTTAEMQPHLRGRILEGKLPDRRVAADLPRPTELESKAMDTHAQQVSEQNFEIATSERFIARLQQEIKEYQEKAAKATGTQAETLLQDITYLQHDIRNQERRRDRAQKALEALQAKAPSAIATESAPRLELVVDNDRNSENEVTEKIGLAPEIQQPEEVLEPTERIIRPVDNTPTPASTTKPTERWNRTVAEGISQAPKIESRLMTPKDEQLMRLDRGIAVIDSQLDTYRPEDGKEDLRQELLNQRAKLVNEYNFNKDEDAWFNQQMPEYNKPEVYDRLDVEMRKYVENPSRNFLEIANVLASDTRAFIEAFEDLRQRGLLKDEEGHDITLQRLQTAKDARALDWLTKRRDSVSYFRDKIRKAMRTSQRQWDKENR